MKTDYIYVYLCIMLKIFFKESYLKKKNTVCLFK